MLQRAGRGGPVFSTRYQPILNGSGFHVGSQSHAKTKKIVVDFDD